MIELMLGTVICAVITSFGIFIGADGRRIRKVKDENDNEEFVLMRADNCVKILEISPGVVIAGTGNWARFERICDFWNEKPEGFVIDFDGAHSEMETFCMGKTLPMGEDGIPMDMPQKRDSDCCTLFLVGKSEKYKQFAIYKMCDNKDEVAYGEGTCFDDSFVTIGSGRKYAGDKWDSFNESKGTEERTKEEIRDEFTQDEITLRLINSLVEACMLSPGCGGDILVHKVEEKSTTMLESKHLIDLMIKLETPIKRSELLLFSKCLYKHVNYHNLGLHFKNDFGGKLDSPLKCLGPKCLGEVVPGWKCFVVDLIDAENNDKSGKYFKSCGPVNINGKDLDKKVIRYNEIGEYPFCVARGDGPTLLKDAREGKLLS